MQDKHFNIIPHSSFLSKVEHTHIGREEEIKTKMCPLKGVSLTHIKLEEKAGSGNQTVDTPFLTTDTSQEKA